MAKKLKKVFLSYSNDSVEHKKWVRKLAGKLKQKEFEILIDTNLKQGESILLFMENSIKEADYIVPILTPTYKQIYENRMGSAGLESTVIYEDGTTNNNNKYLPILRSGDANSSIPTSFKGKIYIDFRDDKLFLEELNKLVLSMKAPQAKPTKPTQKLPTKKVSSISKKLEQIEIAPAETNIEITPIPDVPETQAMDLPDYGLLPEIDYTANYTFDQTETIPAETNIEITPIPDEPETPTAYIPEQELLTEVDYKANYTFEETETTPYKPYTETTPTSYAPETPVWDTTEKKKKPIVFISIIVLLVAVAVAIVLNADTLYTHFYPSQSTAAEIHFKLGKQYVSSGKYAASIASFTKAIEHNPNNATYYYNRGMAKAKLNQNPCSDFTEACRLGNTEACNYVKKGCK